MYKNSKLIFSVCAKRRKGEPGGTLLAILDSLSDASDNDFHGAVVGFSVRRAAF